MRRVADFPQLLPLAARSAALRDEARAALAALGEAAPLLPLFPQPRGGRAYAELFPVATSMCRGTRGVLAAALCVIPPGTRREAVGGDPRTVTALIVLEGTLLAVGAGATVLLDGDARNDGPGEALALLVQLEAAAETPAAQLARRVLHDVFEAGRATADLSELDRLATQWRGAFPDLSIEILELVSDGARVACAVRAQGTQTGHLHNLPATGARIAWMAAFFFTADGGRIVAATVVWDLFALLQQLREALRVG